MKKLLILGLLLLGISSIKLFNEENEKKEKKKSLFLLH